MRNVINKLAAKSKAAMSAANGSLAARGRDDGRNETRSEACGAMQPMISPQGWTNQEDTCLYSIL